MCEVMYKVRYKNRQENLNQSNTLVGQRPRADIGAQAPGALWARASSTAGPGALWLIYRMKYHIQGVK